MSQCALRQLFPLPLAGEGRVRVLFLLMASVPQKKNKTLILPPLRGGPSFSRKREKGQKPQRQLRS